MATDYRLWIGTRESGRRVAEVLLHAGITNRVLDPSVTVDQLLDGWSTVRRTWLRVLERTPRYPYNVVEDSFGFVPTVSVGFRESLREEQLPQLDDMIRLVAALLDQIPGDAVLYNDAEDEVWLLRRNGELSVRDNPEYLPERRLALLTPPFRRETHRFS